MPYDKRGRLVHKISTCVSEGEYEDDSNMTEDKKYGHPRFYELLEKMAEIHSKKNHDYAGTENPLYNFKSVERMNMLPSKGVFVRMFDKWSRLENFVKSGELYVKDESVQDTLIDLANYALLMLILIEDENEARKKKDSDKIAEREKNAMGERKFVNPLGKEIHSD